jgi:hypothetical protein
MDDRDIIRSFESVSNKRVVVIVALVLIVVAVVIGVVVSGFRGQQIKGGAEAVTKTGVGPTEGQTAPPSQPPPGR